MRTIKLKEINLYTALFSKDKVTIVYGLVDENGNEWHQKRIEISPEDFTEKEKKIKDNVLNIAKKKVKEIEKLN